MVATFKKFKFENNQYNETFENSFIGYTFEKEGQNYKAVCTSFTANFDKKEWTFIFTLFVLNNITQSWSYVTTEKICADTNVFRNSSNELFYNSGDNNDSDNIIDLKAEANSDAKEENEALDMEEEMDYEVDYD